MVPRTILFPALLATTALATTPKTVVSTVTVTSASSTSVSSYDPMTTNIWISALNNGEVFPDVVGKASMLSYCQSDYYSTFYTDSPDGIPLTTLSVKGDCVVYKDWVTIPRPSVRKYWRTVCPPGTTHITEYLGGGVETVSVGPQSCWSYEAYNKPWPTRAGQTIYSTEGS
ncbi:hypothetical protein C1H76_1209 [Elsinoe australis]|uniref:Uncharacterized protein n=1 Tax=Elsinoe australis TaxID=40998 RepID=A0A4U7BF23_9PEZI|nr:hypothetical protein C1H76_1209 [Elsinoe australis]